jgi:ssDNA-binding Zn-finger/Zn-ribbon topoisomerase 1
MTLKFNACPKCQGDLQIKRDIYGMFINCLQCGLQKDLDAPTAAVEIGKAKRLVAKSQASTELLRAA